MQNDECQPSFSDKSKGLPPRKPTNEAAGRSREYLLEHEINALLAAAKSTGRHGHRDYCIVLLAYRHGLRVGEVIDLKWEQIDFHRGHIHIKRLKGGDSSVQPLAGIELRCLRRLQRECASTPFVFCSQRGGPLTERSVHRLVAAAGRKAKLGFATHPHMLRHACGYQLANRGVDTRAIQGYLGHKNIAHTVRYSQLSASRFNEFSKLL